MPSANVIPLIQPDTGPWGVLHRGLYVHCVTEHAARALAAAKAKRDPGEVAVLMKGVEAIQVVPQLQTVGLE